MDEVELVNRQILPDSLPTTGNSRLDRRQFLHREPANLAYRTGKNCALSVSDQLSDKSLVIRVDFFEIHRDSSCIRFFDLEDAA